ncbi:CHAP domain-containing protein [Trabulsiella odontotermitis]|uniref:CHAP domain-containing protein n=1 Tax=Trabulsiella odontotermitis TaxID=379893 RepID=UPI0006BA1698|nr:CHAP domain-containing protein [Trabulsiella odontotermitis]
MTWDIRTATSYAKNHAHAHSVHRCAEYTRKAIGAGGIILGNTGHAKDYGSLLINAGFRAISPHESPKAGDVVILQPYEGGNPSGHMAIFDGQDWYSDFRQRDMWSGPGYRAAKPDYIIYRKD